MPKAQVVLQLLTTLRACTCSVGGMGYWKLTVLSVSVSIQFPAAAAICVLVVLKSAFASF